MLEEKIETRANAQKIWESWEKAHAIEGQKGIIAGQRGVSKKSRYQILNVIPGKEFTILWKTLFVRFYFTHRVEATTRGSLISYSVQIKGLFKHPVRLILKEKIRQNLTMVLKKMASNLE